MADPLAALNELNQLLAASDVVKAAVAQGTQSSESAAVTDLTLACQGVINVAMTEAAADENGSAEFVYITALTATAAAASAESICHNLSADAANAWNSIFNQAQTDFKSLNSDFEQSPQTFSDFGDLYDYAIGGNVLGAVATGQQLASEVNLADVTVNLNGSYTQSDTNSTGDWTAAQTQYTANFTPSGETVSWQNGITTTIQVAANTVGVTLTDADNDSSMSFNLEGAPSIETAVDNTSVAADVAAILIGMNGSTITDQAAPSILLALGANGTINGSGAGDQIGVNGANVNISDSNAAVTLTADSSVGINGAGGNNVTLESYVGNGDQVTFGQGAGNVVVGSYGTISLAADSNAVVSGNLNSIDVNSYAGNGTVLTVEAGSTADWISGSYVTAYLPADSNDGITGDMTAAYVNSYAGNGTVVTVAAGSTADWISGSYVTAYLPADSNDGITGDMTAAYVNSYAGNGTVVTVATGSTADWISGSYVIAYLPADSNDGITGDMTAAYVNSYAGNGTVVTVAAGSTADWISGSYVIAYLPADSNDGITGNSTTAYVDSYAGNGTSLTLAAGSTGDLIYGSYLTMDTAAQDNFTLEGSYTGLYLAHDNIMTFESGAGDIVHATGDNIEVASGRSLEIIGDNDKVIGSDDQLTFIGNQDATFGNYDTVNGYGLGDVTDGLDNADDDGEYQYDGGYSYGYGWYGMAQGGPKIAGSPAHVIAQYDRAQGFTGAAAQADAAYEEAAKSAAGALPASAASFSTMAAASIGPRWSGFVVDWAFAAGATAGPAPFSGAIAGQYQPIIEQAIDAWANASGLSFQQVSDPSTADFVVGWGDFDTAASGIVGYTHIPTTADHLIMPGAVVRLEDPSQTPFVQSDAGPTYENTAVTLYQTALHEIGHALGLGDTSDPNSAMYYALGSVNQALNATDTAAIQQIYAPVDIHSGASPLLPSGSG